MDLQVNQILQTKDGRIVGNAIVMQVNPLKIKTDYGSIIMGTTPEEVNELWYIADMTERYDIDTHKHYTKI